MLTLSYVPQIPIPINQSLLHLGTKLQLSQMNLCNVNLCKALMTILFFSHLSLHYFDFVQNGTDLVFEVSYGIFLQCAEEDQRPAQC